MVYNVVAFVDFVAFVAFVAFVLAADIGVVAAPIPYL